MTPQQESETFRRLFARRPQTLDEAQCPPPETLFDAASGAITGHRLNLVIDHVSECAQCSESWRIARELVVPPTATTEARNPLWFAMATAATIVLSASLWLNTQNNATQSGVSVELRQPVLRGTEQDANISSATSRSYSRTSLTLRWQTKKPWPSYSVTLMDEDLDTLWSTASVANSSVAIPAAALTNVTPGDVLFWQVEAWRDGVRQEVSELFTITATAD